jgi:hypothetical protein
MPVLEGYVYADTPHEKTVIGASYRYGCHNRERRSSTIHMYQAGWTADGRRNMVPVRSEWLDIPCPHDVRASDPACAGCKHRDPEKEEKN